MIDGAYVQSEDFIIRFGYGSPLHFTWEQVVELHRVTGEMIKAREEARAFPWGEYAARCQKARLPVKT